MFSWLVNGQRAMPGGFSDGRIAQDNTQGAGFVPGPLLADLNSDGTLEILWGDNTASLHARAVVLRDANADSLADDLFKLNVTGTGTVAPAVSGNMLLYGDNQGRIHLFGFDGGGSVSSGLSTTALQPLSESGATLAVYRHYSATGSSGNVALFADTRPARILPADRIVNLGHPIAGPAAVGDFGVSGMPVLRAAMTARDGLLFLLDGTLSLCPGFPVQTGQNQRSSGSRRSQWRWPP